VNPAAPADWAAALGISREAVEVWLGSEVIDLHVDSFIWSRVLGRDPTARQGAGPLGGWFFGHTDLWRMLAAGIGGATWSITTNPFRTASGRRAAFRRNLARLLETFSKEAGRVAVVRSAAEYRAARRAGRHGAWVGVQGGNALDVDISDWDRIEGDAVTRVTLVHLTGSRLGSTSSPLERRDRGLTDLGRELVRKLDERRIFVDLAHASRRAFFDAVAVHDPSLPLVVTHTGVSAVHRHWRNLDDEQLRAVARTGGTVGIILHSGYLGVSPWSTSATRVVDHLEHVIRTVGEEHASLGTDFDGAIIPPSDLRSCLELPRLVQVFLDRRWPVERIQGVLGGNFLRALERLRG